MDRSRANHASGSKLEASGAISRGDVRIQRPGRSRPDGSGVIVEMERQDISTSERGSEQISVLEIAPRMAPLRNDGVIEFEELSSTVRLVPGQWFDLAAAMHAHDEVSQAILSHARKSDEQKDRLWIMVE